MVKHNNVVPNQHFRKYWAQHVRTWFDQPARKQRRRNARIARAKQLAPRPIASLKPIVRGSTNKYNARARQGRGFTLDEIHGAKINRKEAKGLGINIDHRRKNRSEEGFALNVNRLKAYKQRLVIFPRKTKDPKKGDSTPAERKLGVQVINKSVIPVHVPVRSLRARKITQQERDTVVAKVLRKSLTDQKLAGAREKRAKDKANKPKPKEKETAVEE